MSLPGLHREVEGVAQHHFPGLNHIHTGVDAGEQHSGRRVAHVCLFLGDQPRDRKRLQRTGLEFDVEAQFFKVAQFFGHPQVEIVHHFQGAARRDPDNFLWGGIGSRGRGFFGRRRGRRCCRNGGASNKQTGNQQHCQRQQDTATLHGIPPLGKHG